MLSWIKHLCLFMTLLCIAISVPAQQKDMTTYKETKGSNYDEHFIIAVVDQESYQQSETILPPSLLESSKTTLLVFAADHTTLFEIYTILNQRMNDQSKRLSKTNLHLLLIGEESLSQKFSRIDLSYFNTYTYLAKDKSVAGGKITTISSNKWNPAQYIEAVKGKYKWRLEVEGGKAPIRHIKKHREGKFTLGYRSTLNISSNKSTSVLTNHYTHGLFMDFRIANNLQAIAGVNFNLNRTDPQRAAQSQIFDQIDIFGALNGTNSQQTINLNLDVKGRFYFAGHLGLRYLFGKNKRLVPYVQTQLSLPIARDLKGTLDTTLTIDIANAFSGGLGPGLNPEDLDPESAGLTIRSGRNLNLGFGLGFQYKLTGHIRFDLGLDYSGSIQNLETDSQLNNNGLSVSFGFHFRFSDHKEYYLEHFY